MAERPKLDLGLTGYDELFMTDSERQQNKLPRIHDVPLELIDDFPGHPFKVRMDEDMQQLVDSIKERGVLIPVFVTTHEAGKNLSNPRIRFVVHFDLPADQKLYELHISQIGQLAETAVVYDLIIM